MGSVDSVGGLEAPAGSVGSVGGCTGCRGLGECVHGVSEVGGPAGLGARPGGSGA